MRSGAGARHDAERFNGRIEEVLRANRFDSALDMGQTLMPYVDFISFHLITLLPSPLMSRTPMHALKDWHKSHPHLFDKTLRNRPGRNT